MKKKEEHGFRKIFKEQKDQLVKQESLWLPASHYYKTARDKQIYTQKMCLLVHTFGSCHTGPMGPIAIRLDSKGPQDLVAEEIYLPLDFVRELRRGSSQDSVEV